MKVSVLGTGYVGLVSGVCLAAKGHEVVCVDADNDKVRKINQGVPPIFEKGLKELLSENVGTKLHATTDLAKAVAATELSLIAVGTPFDGHEIDLSHIKDLSRGLGRMLKDKESYHTVVVKSTVVPGTTDEIILPLLEKHSGKKAGIDFGLGMNPEFLREGEAIKDFMSPDRIVLGGIDVRTLDTLEDLYRPFRGARVIRTNNKTAEMVKYTSNSLLATMISFSNEIANLCAGLGDIDVVDVMQGVHLDKRLSPMLSNGERITPSFTTYLEAGCGFGGSCFPKDVKALIAHGKKHGELMHLLDAVIRINEEQPRQILSLLYKHFPSLENVRVAVLGLAFKPGTDDMRESPAIPIVNTLLAQGAKVKAYDPVANDEARKLFGANALVYCTDLMQTVRDVEAIVLLTRWEEFSKIPELLREQNPTPLFVDGRRMLDKRSIRRYEGIGL
jgi:UDPglucose 6-dehydrogenase/GDP-mannose 6-dehydrogenase